MQTILKCICASPRLLAVYQHLGLRIGVDLGATERRGRLDRGEGGAWRGIRNPNEGHGVVVYTLDYYVCDEWRGDGVGRARQ